MPEVLTRPYAPPDLTACLAVFDGNVPDFFAPTEREEFRAHLLALPDTAPAYLVLTHAGGVVACGGLTVANGQGDARLVWGMVSRDWQGRGLGRRLLQERLSLARGLLGLRTVSLSTSQHTRGFYAGAGFVLTGVVRDGFGAGLDQCDMVLTLSPGCS
jgi:N-acetylglutamate synthase-like GNAT family acetyltransferase